MTPCPSIHPLFTLIILVLGVTMIQSFTLHHNTHPAATRQTSTFLKVAETVEVCGFKDCKRAGGGPRLEKLVNSIVEEKGLVDSVKVEGCECQGECGYGPNLVVDGKIVNYVKKREDVMKALGIEEEAVAGEE